MENLRLFVGNLTNNVEQEDLETKFKVYGNVSKVDIKDKLDFEGNILSRFAYVNISSERNLIQQCVYECDGSNWKGSAIKVDVAKESFLQRLQRERKENEKPAKETSVYEHIPEKKYNFSVVSEEEKSLKSRDNYCDENNDHLMSKDTEYEHFDSYKQEPNNDYKQQYNEDYNQQYNEEYNDYKQEYNEDFKQEPQSNYKQKRSKHAEAPQSKIKRFDPTLPDHQQYCLIDKIKKPQQQTVEKVAELADNLEFGNNSSSGFSFLSKFDKNYKTPKGSMSESEEEEDNKTTISLERNAVQELPSTKRKPFFRRKNDPVFQKGIEWILTPLTKENLGEFESTRKELIDLYMIRSKRAFQKIKNRSFKKC